MGLLHRSEKSPSTLARTAITLIVMNLKESALSAGLLAIVGLKSTTRHFVSSFIGNQEHVASNTCLYCAPNVIVHFETNVTGSKEISKLEMLHEAEFTKCLKSVLSVFQENGIGK